MKKVNQILLISLFSTIPIDFLFAQNKASKTDSKYWEINLSIGHLIPNYPKFPSTSYQKGISFSLGKLRNEDSNLTRFYNYSKTGVDIALNTFGNNRILGHSAGLIPYSEFKIADKWSIKTGLGMNFHTKSTTEIPSNRVLGSKLNWGFQLSIQRYITLIESGKFIKIGAVFIHSSNGHVQLPNYGLNGFSLNLGIQNFYNGDGSNFGKNDSKPVLSKNKSLLFSSGIGVQEFGGTNGPVGGDKKLVHTQSVSVGFQKHNHYRFYIGIGHRYYMSFADSLNNDPSLRNTGNKPNNLFFLFSNEFIGRNVSFEIDVGVNFYKPFYPHFIKKFERKSEKHTLKKVLISRIGLSYYFRDPHSGFRNNLRLGAFVNANLVQADFMELTLFYLWKF